ncbi:hypothetical protein QYM41_16955 [Kocuria sp. CPCC 205268]|uniref:hypothetical protein n=1 Tax=Kocuria oxytropis TaxID=3058913 RepID=UPI0034D69181
MGSGSTGSNIGLGSPVGRRHEIGNIKGAVERLDDDFDGYTLIDADGVDMVQIQTVIRAESTDSEVAAAVAKLARIADSIEASVSQVDEW